MPQHPDKNKPIVVVIDDDAGVREALQGLFDSVGLAVESHGSVQEFIAAARPDGPGCMVLDIRLPGQSGLDFQEALARNGATRPIILISAHADIPMSVRAMKAGAFEFLTKPVREQDLLDAVQRAIEQDATRRREAASCASIEERYGTLSDREREVMALVVTGMMNKQIAAAMSLTEGTVKLHRGQAMHKMAARTVVELVRMADVLERKRLRS